MNIDGPHLIKLRSINVLLVLLQPDVEFVWWWGVVGCGGVWWGAVMWWQGGVCKVIFVSNPTAVLRLRLCCVVFGESLLIIVQAIFQRQIFKNCRNKQFKIIF